MTALRPYQTRAIGDVRAAYASGKRAPLCVLPTGAGKTVLAAEMIRSAVQRGNRTLFLAHRDELIGQSVAKLGENGIHDVRVIRAASDLGSPIAPIVVASIQTLTRRPDSRMPHADFVIFDEAHHTVARTWDRIATHYSGAFLLGLTATPQRGDGKALGDVFDAIVTGATSRELTELGHLVPCIVLRPEQRLSSSQTAQSPADAYAAHGRGERAVVFCGSIKRAHEIAESMPVRSAVVHGNLPGVERAEMLQRFRAGEIRVVVNVHCLTEGFDDPAVSVCILERNPEHHGIYLQMVGRALRPAPGKTHAILLDLCGASHKHGLPTDDREFSLDGKGIKLGAREPVAQCPSCGAAFAPGPTTCPLCGEALPHRGVQPLRVLGIPLTDAATQRPAPRPSATIALTSKYPGTCRTCRGHIAVGDRIFWTKGEKPRHAGCGINIAEVNKLMAGVA